MASVTAADIEAEHIAALNRLDADQRAALRRTRDALRRGNFSHHNFKQSLLEVLREDVVASGRVGPQSSATPFSDAVDALEKRHLAALAALDHEQRDALHRIERALQINNFSHNTLRETLLHIFEQEAALRNQNLEAAHAS